MKALMGFPVENDIYSKFYTFILRNLFIIDIFNEKKLIILNITSIIPNFFYGK